MDTLRADALSCYGGTNPTPYIDTLARSGAIFERAMTAGHWTIPSFASAYTSLETPVHRVYNTDFALPDSATTVAEILNAAGYETIYLGQTEQMVTGFDQGFESVLVEKDADTLFQRAAHLLKNNRKRPFFLLLFHRDVHIPYACQDDPDADRLEEKISTYQAPDEKILHWLKNSQTLQDVPVNNLYVLSRVAKMRICIALLNTLRKYSPRYETLWRATPSINEELQLVRNVYDCGVRRLDRYMGHLCENLTNAGLDNNTLLIFTADHGEAFFEHETIDHDQNYREVLHIPLLFRMPGTIPPATRHPFLMSNLDIFPTILSLCGLPQPGWIQGKALFGPDAPKEAPEQFELLSWNYEKFGYIRYPWKLVKGVLGQLHLFNMEKDFYEQNDLIKDTGSHEIVEQVFQNFESRLKMDTEKCRELFGVDPPPQMHERERGVLRSLGYLQ